MKKEKNYITPKGLKKLLEELHALNQVERPALTQTIAWAAANGDRSENADYIYGKKRLREIDRRVRFLSGRIDAAVEVDPAKQKNSKVQFGATVSVESDEGESKKVSIVGIDEIDTDKGHISWKSPLGAALIGKAEGDSVEVNTPKGKISYDILEIIYREIT
jgi:transcription elongation factor GreB